MKPQIFVMTTHHPEALSSRTKKAQEKGQSVNTARPFIAFNPSEVAGVDMTPKAKPFRKMNAKEQIESDAQHVPGSLDSILAQVDMGEG